MSKYYQEFGKSPIYQALTTTTSLGNLAYQVDEGKGVFNNRIKLCKELNIDTKNLILTHQSHSSIIKRVTKDDLGKGELSFESGVEADGLYTNEKSIAIGIFHADCVPIFFYDKAKKIIGIIHCGYRGTLKHAAKIMLETYLKDNNASIKDIELTIGPARRLDSFEINEESKEEINKSLLYKYIKGNKFDMVQSNIDDFLSLGMDESQIFDSKFDTVTNDTFFSAYKKIPNGRMVSLIKFN